MAAAPYTVSSMRAVDVHNSSGTEIILSSQFSPGTISYMQQPSMPLHSFHSGSPFGSQLTMNPPIGPVPSSKQSQQMHGMYSNSGFDMLGILSRLANRPNPQIDLGPVDLSCSFVVADATQYDNPIIYASPMFERMTQYSASEAIGLNCRFLQAPDGQVEKGSTRKYTDNSSVVHIRQHMSQGKESQASLVNYRKGGQPFVNLVTVIPICWDSEDVSYFVGLQVDMLRQPESILEQMKNGTYATNYQTIVIPPVIPSVSASVDNQDASDGPLEYYRPDSIPHNRASLDNSNHYNLYPARDTQSIQSVLKQASSSSTRILKRPKVTKSVIDILLTQKAETVSLKRQWNQVILANSNDFIHVLSLKGIFLYCSNSARDIIGYDPSELLGTQISSICHPSDMIPVMRELKESPSSKAPLNLIYRIKRKHGGYMWIECHGRLDLEQGKGRKCIVMSGRERPVFTLPRKAIIDADAFVQANTDMKYEQFWSKLSIDGLMLYTSSSAQHAFEFSIQDLNGLSIFQLVPEEENNNISNALAKALSGQTVTIMHSIRTAENKTVSVYSSFYPGNSSAAEEKPAFVLLQVRYQEKKPLENRSASQTRQKLTSKADEVAISECSESTAESDTESSTSSEMDPILSNVMNSLDAPVEENFFCELETMRPTSWQFELHQMRLTNKRLRERIERLTKRSASQGQR
ncbi:hypothetical protein INT43_002541 [Umbelopsis isabellina]|uniref:PAS domain-containing protein n=1 Tax=Mortierella isabellina TaxID=91625 RepID=A0A8H7Q6D5_MORIS|nr:hypothetical protein INT43_002541 [Umbelopsis isabellina]